jgi:hypothetical protein
MHFNSMSAKGPEPETNLFEIKDLDCGTELSGGFGHAVDGAAGLILSDGVMPILAQRP